MNKLIIQILLAYSPVRSILCQICMPIVYIQAELCVFKVIKLHVQIRPVFVDLVTL